VSLPDKPELRPPGLKSYSINLGNTEPRSGHRRDCHQVRAYVTVQAHSPQEALDLVKAKWKPNRGRHDKLAAQDRCRLLVGTGLDLSLDVYVRVDGLALKDVSEVAK
jgi:hypothetical protein